MNEKLKLDNQLCFRLYSASRLLTKAYHPMLSVFGLTYPQYLVLMVLWEKDGQPVNDIAKRLLLETNTVTPLLKRMEEACLVRRERSETDGRQMIVSLTETGRALETAMAPIPDEIGNAVICRSVTHETAPNLFLMLDDIIEKLQDNLLQAESEAN